MVQVEGAQHNITTPSQSEMKEEESVSIRGKDCWMSGESTLNEKKTYQVQFEILIDFRHA